MIPGPAHRGHKRARSHEAVEGMGGFVVETAGQQL